MLPPEEYCQKKEGKRVCSPLASAQNSITFAGVTPEGKITLLYPDNPKQGAFFGNRKRSIFSRLKSDDKERKRPDHGIYTITFLF